MELANRSENIPKEVIPARINGTRAYIAIRNPPFPGEKMLLKVRTNEMREMLNFLTYVILIVVI